MKNVSSATKMPKETNVPTARNVHLKERFFENYAVKDHSFFNPASLQPKLKIGQAGDKYEREADRVADNVINTPDIAIQRHDVDEIEHHMKAEPGVQMMCDGCREEEEVQRKPLIRLKAESSPAAPPELSLGINSVKSTGKSLPENTAQEMGFKIGADFKRVRIHTDSQAVQLNRQLGARAFTTGKNIFFNRGEYSPDTINGKRLLAHELVHTVQQGGINNVIQRTPDEATLRQFDEISREIRQHEAFRRLDRTSRGKVLQIIRLARSRDNAMYYITNLRDLINTPDAPSAAQASSVSNQMAEHARQERARLADPVASAQTGREEDFSADPARVWTERTGVGGKKFYVDVSDPNHIFVRLRVWPRPAGSGTQADVNNLLAMEDAIEKYASTIGYSVDVEFVDSGGRDVFAVNVDPARWATSGNWVGDAFTMGHELHHLLGLDDRYNYIDDHATNAQMVMSDRIYWFREQMNRPDDPHISTSIMGEGEIPVDDDVCRVAGLDVATCSTTRDATRSQKFREAKISAQTKTFQAWVRASAIYPYNMMTMVHYVTTVAGDIFGTNVDYHRIMTSLEEIRNKLSLPIDHQLTPLIHCFGDNLIHVQNQNPPVNVCPQFFEASLENRKIALMLASIHLANITTGANDSQCSIDNCNDECSGGTTNSYGWIKLIHCLS
jgi:hypothetical protein